MQGSFFFACLLFSLMNNVMIGFLLCSLTDAFRSILAKRGVDLLSTVAEKNDNVCLKKSKTFCSVAQKCSFFLMIGVGIGSIQFRVRFSIHVGFFERPRLSLQLLLRSLSWMNRCGLYLCFSTKEFFLMTAPRITSTPC